MLVYISCLPKIEAQDFGDLFLIFGDEMVSSRCLIQRYSMIQALGFGCSMMPQMCREGVKSGCDQSLPALWFGGGVLGP